MNSSPEDSVPERASPHSSGSRSTRWKRAGRLLLFVLGVVALLTMIRQVGGQQILSAIAGTAPWLPLICLLDFAWVALEGGGLLSIYGAQGKKIPLSAWLYVSFVHYTTFMLLPMGRASAEVTRAALVKKYVDRDLAVVGAALMQSLTMVSNGLTSLVSAAIVASLVGVHTLLWALLGNAALMFMLGISAYLVLRHVKVGGLLGRRFARLAQAGPGFDRYFSLTRSRHPKALGYCFLGRWLQTTQYGVILLAVTGSSSIGHAWVAEGIQMAARSAGDFIPNQVGVTEGAFVYFREVLGLMQLPALAMTVALVARISNVGVATLCAALAQIWPRRTNATLPSAATELDG